MFKFILKISLVSVFLGVCLYLSCALPSDPIDDPNNVTLEIINKNGNIVIQDTPVPITVVVNIPKHVQKITVKFGNDEWDTTLNYSNPSRKSDTINIIGTFHSPGTNKKIEVAASLFDSNYKDKEASLTVDVISKEIKILFDSIPKAHLIQAKKTDSLKFVAHTDPVAGIIFDIVSTPAVDTSCIHTKKTNSSVTVYFKAPQSGNYKIVCHTQSGTVTDSASVTLTAFDHSLFSDLPTLSDSFVLGKSDTLFFTAFHDTAVPLRLSLANKDSFTNNTITTLVTSPDTLKIVFMPNVSKIYSFKIAAAGNYISDTIIIQRTVTNSAASLWKQSSINVSGTEGVEIKQTLNSLLIDSTISEISFSTTEGTILNNEFHWLIPWGCSPIDTITITASRKESKSAIKLIVQAAPGDHKKPTIQRSFPADEHYTTNSSQFTCKFTITDSGAGVRNVVFSIGNRVLTDTLHNDSSYQCIIDSLIQGKVSVLKVTATDASMNHNTDSAFVYITYDSTTKDNTPPAISIKNGPASGSRTKEANGSYIVTITDPSGVDSVHAYLNGILLSGITVTGDDYTIPYALLNYGNNKIIISAVDKSSARNRDSIVISFTYNTAISPIVLSTPANGATGVSTTPVFSWSGGTDADNDTVFYNVLYGASATSLISNAGEVTKDTLNLASSKKLISNTKYYWQVIAYSHAYTDTVRSEIQSFTTIDQAPTLTLVFPVKGATKVDPSSGKLQFAASDPDSGSNNKMTFSVLVSDSKQNILNTVMRLDSLTTQSVSLSDLPKGPLAKAKKYYWQVIANDNSAISKSTTSAIDSFYTVNSAPVWSAIPSKDSTYYKCNIDLSKYCSDPDGHGISYKVITGTNASINGTILSCVSDSALITIQAKDTFSVQPCSTNITFRRWFTSPQMKLIPSGGASFQMGTVDSFLTGSWFYQELGLGQDQYWNDGKPLHNVSFKNNFLMDSTEVTQYDYEHLMNINPSNSTKGANIAVHNVTWCDAVLYCNARSKRDGLDTVYTYSSITGIAGNGCSKLNNIQINYLKNGYRLPTEAEWEFACRAGTTTPNYWTDNDSTKYAWYYKSIDNTLDAIHAVAQLVPNSYKLYDMIGNVAEWCNDWYGIYTKDSQIDPVGPSTETIRVSRGSFGEWQTFTSSSQEQYWTYANSAFRYSNGPYGFRCVRTKFQ